MVNLDLPILNRVKNILTKTEKIDTDVTSVLTKLAEQGVDIDSIITSIGKSGDQASAATIFGKLAGLASQSGGIIKSIQIGGGSPNYSGENLSNVDIIFNVNISTVNPKNTIALIFPNVLSYSGTGNSSTQSSINFRELKITANKLQLKPPQNVQSYKYDNTRYRHTYIATSFQYIIIEFN